MNELEIDCVCGGTGKITKSIIDDSCKVICNSCNNVILASDLRNLLRAWYIIYPKLEKATANEKLTQENEKLSNENKELKIKNKEINACLNYVISHANCEIDIVKEKHVRKINEI